jgi:hypothetical protein
MAANQRQGKEQSREQEDDRSASQSSQVLEKDDIDFNNLSHLTLIHTNPETLNKRLLKYQGCNVVNLSSATISESTLRTLSFGLSFCPTPQKPNKALLFEGVEKFIRKIKLRCHFGKRPESSQETPTDPLFEPSIDQLFKIPSNWIPEIKDSSVIQFTNIIRKLLLFKKETNAVHSNISLKDLKEIQDLSKNPDLTIKKADKGNSIVIMDTVDYLHEGFRQLSDTNFYQKMEEDLTTIHEGQVNRIIHELFVQKLITKKTKNFLWAKNCRTARFYLLPKIHKKNIPGRPIVSATGCPTEKLSQLIDQILNPLVVKTSSYLRDTTDFINKISNITFHEDDNIILATMDVTSLYTNIPGHLGLRCVAKVLAGNSHLLLPPHKILEILRVVLNCNNFEFNGVHYLQVQGVSMGTKCAPTYANLVLSVLEKEFLNSLELKPLCWFRFIDDIFCVYQHGLENLKKLVEKFNNTHDTLKLTLEWSEKEIAFLDTVVYREKTGLKTKLYKKPTDATNYLMHNSAHPPGCKKGFKSQALRVRRNCSTVEDFLHFIEPLKRAYVERGYPPTELDRIILETRNLDRKSLLQIKKRPNNEDSLVCTIPYNLKDIPARKIILKYWHILQESPTVGHLFQKIPTFGYYRPKNFKELLCRAKITYPTQPQSLEATRLALETDLCDRLNCRDCKLLDFRTHFKSTVTKIRYKKCLEAQKADCETLSLIYLITCEKCNLQYVGETKRTAVIRLKEHRYDTKSGKDTPVAKHFRQPGHVFEKARIEVIDVIKSNPDCQVTENRRISRETHWIITLKTLSPLGINGRLGRPISSS